MKTISAPLSRTLVGGFFCALSLLAAARPAQAQVGIEDKVEAYKKALEAEQRRRELVNKGNDLEWDDLVAGTPRVISFALRSSTTGLDLSGPYVGYMFTKNIEVGLDSSFKYDSSTNAAKDKDPKFVTNNREYFFGSRFTVSFPVNPHIVVFATVSPGLTGGLTQTKTTIAGVVTDDKRSWGPGFSLRVMPIGVGFRTNQFEVRTAMFLSYAKSGGEIGTEDATLTQFGFEHAAGLLEIRHYF